MGGGGHGGPSPLLPLGGHVAGQLLIAEHRGRHGGGQPQLLPQAVEHLVQGDTAEADGRQQVLGAHQVAAAGHLGDRLAVEQGIEAVAAQLPLQHGGAALDVLVAVALLVPLADAVARRGGGHEVEPIEAGVGGLGGDDLHEVAVLQRRGQRAEAVVDAHALAVVAHLGVNPVGEVHRGGTLAQPHHIPLGGEHEHFLVEEVLLDRAQEVAAVLTNVVLLPVHQLPQPVEPLRIGTGSGGGSPLLVFPVGGDAEFGHLVHLSGADLHLDRPMATDHRRVQRLVAVGLGQADVVLEPAGDRPEGVVHHRQGAVAALQVGADDPQGRHVVDLVERLLLALHLAPDAIEVFGPTAHIAALQTRRHQPVAQQAGGDPQPLLPLGALGGHLLLDFAEGVGLQDLEGQVLQFPLQPSDAEAVGQGAIDLARFPGDALLLLGLERPEGAHVVEAIGQLHQHHPDVAGHGQEHAPQVLRLGFRFVGEVDASEFGDPLHQSAHLGAEMLLNLLRGDLRVLHHVVEETGGDHAGAGADVPQQIGHRHRVADVGLTAGPHLAVVELESEMEGRRQQPFGVGGAAVSGAGGHVLDAAPQPVG